MVHSGGMAVKRIVVQRSGMAKDDLYFRLRIPDELKAKVQESANGNHRSMTAEIIARLESSFEFDEMKIHADRLADSQDRYVLALEQISDLQRKATEVLGSFVLNPEKIEEFKKNNPEALQRLVQVFSREPTKPEPGPATRRLLNLDDPPTD